MEDVTLAHLFVQRVDALNGDPATGGPRNERLRSGANGLLERPPLAPGLITRFPEVQDGIVAAEHGEGPVVMEHVEPQPIAVKVHRRHRISDWKRRDRLSESCHAGRLQIYSDANGNPETFAELAPAACRGRRGESDTFLKNRRPQTAAQHKVRAFGHLFNTLPAFRKGFLA